MMRIYSIAEIIADEVVKMRRPPSREVRALLERVQARVAGDIERIYRDAVAAGKAYGAETAATGLVEAGVSRAFTLGTLAAALGHLANGQSLGVGDSEPAPPAVTPPEGR